MGTGRTGPRCPIEPTSVASVDATEMAPGVWQGGLGAYAGCPLAFDDLDVVVILCPTDSDQAGRPVKVINPEPIEINLMDSRGDLKKLPKLRRLASRLAIASLNGGRIGIFCWEGRNRSGLMTALTLRRLYGWSGREAMEHIQAERPEALDTDTGAFENYLDGLAPPRAAA